ncbi:MAG: mannose-6-phosphate isomerase, class I [Lentisphaeria bacterium]|nr:mannose-6-phosphate isomerase, class I [Lentisphaeria bacterium]
MNTIFPLDGHVIHHPWGQVVRPGVEPYIADLLGIAAPPDLPFGELWLGTHRAARALVRAKGARLTLDELIRLQPEQVLGKRTLAAGFDDLPFLLKILASGQPLSIQAHPDKALARELHARDPQNYPDANHKPEIAIALTPFSALCGFRPAAAIRADLHRHAELAPLLAGLPDNGDWLRAAYRRLFTVDEAQVRAAGTALAASLAKRNGHTPEEACFLRLWRHFPEDRGTFSAFFLNVLELQPGEALFQAPNEPHAYLEGVAVECMANSNNVVRAGCTKKPIHREVLLSMLTYREGAPDIMRGEALPHGRSYIPPVHEFAIDLLDLPPGQPVEVASDGVVSILLVLAGTCSLEPAGQASLTARRGSSWLWPAALPSATLVCQSETGRVVRARPNL